MISRIRLLGAGMIVLYLVLFVQLNRVQFFGAERLRENPENTRGLVREFGRQRGAIITADDVIIARSVPFNDDIEFRRIYPEGVRYGHITGFQSLTIGATGLEREFNDELAGEPIEQQFSDFGDLLGDSDTTASLILTVRDDVQRVAQTQLGDRRGSVVAVDPRTGAVLALWTTPSFDPNPIADPVGANANAAYEALLADDDDPLLAKSYREIFFPGSTFKVVTAATGLEVGRIGPADPVFPQSDGYEPIPAGARLRNFGGSTCGGDLREILRVSCNTSFAEMGAEWIGPEAMVRGAEAFGFNDEIPFDLPGTATSNFPTEYGERLGTVETYRGEDGVDLANADVDIFEDTARLAQTAIGQNDVAATPLQMALVAAAVANDGVIMRPHVVAELRASDGDVYDRTEPERWRTAISPASNGVLREAMLGVAESGTAQNLRIDGFEVGGKTGTAQLGTDPPQSHAWILGFAGSPGEPAEVAVAVIVEAQPGASEQTGGRVAAPIAKAVMEAVLARS